MKMVTNMTDCLLQMRFILISQLSVPKASYYRSTLLNAQKFNLYEQMKPISTAVPVLTLGLSICDPFTLAKRLKSVFLRQKLQSSEYIARDKRCASKSETVFKTHVNQSRSFFKSSCSNLARRKSIICDPRMSVQYPFVRDDPPEADIISKFETDMHCNDLLLKKERLKREHQGRAKYAATTSILKMTTLNNIDNCKFKFETLNEKDIATVKLGKLILGEKHQHNRRKSEIIILEGRRLIRDALKAGAEAWCMCFCQPDVLKYLDEVQEVLNKVKLYRISPSTMKRYSDTVTPGGLLGVFRKPKQGEVVSPPKSLLPVSLICDNLKDPGNAGTLLRTAAAIGCESIFATEGCVNLWERKVLRSAMGAHFNIPIFTRVSWPQIGNYLGSQTQILLANNYTALDIYMDTDQITQDQLNQEKPLPTSKELTTGGNHGEDGMQGSDSENCYDVPLPVYNYSDFPLDLSEKGKLALVIGNEAAGLSPQAKQFASECNGVYVTIPMNETTNSLNSAIAGSIILYELRKKLLALT